MTREEAIWYLQPIADSASLERYKEALGMAIAALREQDSNANQHVSNTSNALGGWISVEERLPEDLPENKGKKVIPCLVSLKSTYPKGKPNTQKRQRQLQYYGSAGWVWEWSRIGSSRVTHWMPLPEAPKEDA